MSWALKRRIEENDPKEPPQTWKMRKWQIRCKIRDGGWKDIVAYAVNYRQLNRIIDATGVISTVTDVHQAMGDFSHVKAQRIEGLED